MRLDEAGTGAGSAAFLVPAPILLFISISIFISISPLPPADVTKSGLERTPLTSAIDGIDGAIVTAPGAVAFAAAFAAATC
jgi:hypothetical protein